MRILPQPDATTAPYWKAAARGELAIQRCAGCGHYAHPPRERCARCSSSDLRAERVSGRGRVHSFTISHHAASGIPTPFALVLVELEEQRGLRVLANLLECSLDEVRIDMPVEVVFEDVGEGVTLPQFRPVPQNRSHS
jgi:uncharacterized OB-fold protein